MSISDWAGKGLKRNQQNSLQIRRYLNLLFYLISIIYVFTADNVFIFKVANDENVIFL